MGSAMDIVNLVIGIVSTLSILQMIYNWVQGHLPSQKLKTLDDNMQSTSDLFRNKTEEGLLTDSVTKEVEDQLYSIRYQQEELRAKVHSATTFRQQLRGWTSGVSAKLSMLSQETLEIRARISTVSEAERGRLASSGSLPRRPLVQPTDGRQPPQDQSVARRTMNPAFRRLLNVGAPFSGNTLNTLLQAARAPADAQDALRTTIPLVPLPRFSPSPAPADPSASASGVDVSQGGQDLSSRNRDTHSSAAGVASATGATVTPSPVASSSRTPAHENEGPATGTTMSIDDLLSTIGQLNNTVARLGAAVGTRQAVDDHADQPVQD